MAGDAPSGLVGEPEDAAGFVPVEVIEGARRLGVIHVARPIWDNLRPAAQELSFYIQDWGRFRLHFDRPIGRLKP